MPPVTVQDRGQTRLSPDALSERVGTILRDRLYIDVSDADTNLIETGLIDSIALVELLMALEEEFDVELADEDLDLEDFRSIFSIVGFVRQRVEPQG